ncbi:hypothetical protein BVRB_1g017920 [Beta vulgaris subsp. vulgaris]|nr:hypothetical protein BVRB_1g017920 [Beta vulgaris subsp. vulgaris]
MDDAADTITTTTSTTASASRLDIRTTKHHPRFVLFCVFSHFK